MEHPLLKSDDARTRLESWYQRFLDRVEGPVESRTVSTTHGPNHVLMGGDPSHPPLVALHAMMTSSAHLLSELGPLLDRFYIIAPDLPGQSVRGLPTHLPYDDLAHVDWLREVLDALDVHETHIFGVSLGGFVARQFATAHPERVRQLILLVPAGIVQGSVLKGLLKMAVPMVMYKIRPTEKRLRALVDPLLTTWDDDWAHYLGDAFNDFVLRRDIPPVASDAELNALSVPCLVMAAEHDISFPGGPLIERARSHIPNVETELLRDSRHSPPTTDAFRTWMADRITAFVDGERSPSS
jgi:pimeloyl-ACP methyl ester carboxylesterase